MAKNDHRIEVTAENFGALLIEGLQEARAVARGEAEPARRVRRPMTARATNVKPPRAYEAAAIRRIRMRMGLSQNLFARVLNASSETVKAWEQGKRKPDGMALALLQVADKYPEALLQQLREKPARPGQARSRLPTASAPQPSNNPGRIRKIEVSKHR